MIRNRLSKIAQLIRDNADRPRDFRVAKESEAEATIYVYDVIGGFWGGVSAEDYARQLTALAPEVNKLNLRLNTPGGDVFEARAMMVATRQFKGDVVVHIDGLAASAGTSLMMAGSEIKMARGARIMIHKAWTFMMGNEEDLTAEAAVLKGIDDEIVQDYKGRTGKSESELQNWMRAETWFNADAAKDAGFVDEVVETTAKTENRWNLNAYSNVPKELLEDIKPNMPRVDRAALERRLRLFEAQSA
jgi:ATP-dependent Clp protease protease subunit